MEEELKEWLWAMRIWGKNTAEIEEVSKAKIGKRNPARMQARKPAIEIREK